MMIIQYNVISDSVTVKIGSDRSILPVLDGCPSQGQRNPHYPEISFYYTVLRFPIACITGKKIINVSDKLIKPGLI